MSTHTATSQVISGEENPEVSFKTYLLEMNVGPAGQPFVYLLNDLAKFPYDITLRTTDGQEKMAHKAPLIASSPLLKRLLAEAPENQNLDVSMPMLHYILTYIYEGRVDVPVAQVEDFMKAAEALEIEELVKKNQGLVDVVP